MSTLIALKPDNDMIPMGQGNYLLNPTFNKGNYPVWTSWNGMISSSSYQNQRGSYGVGIANWLHYSPIFNQGWSTYVGNQFVERKLQYNNPTNYMNVPYTAVHGFYDAQTDRVIKLYGADNLHESGLTQQRNNDLTRAYNYTGAYAGSSGPPRVISNTTNTSSGVLNNNSASTYNYFHWARHEWTQVVSVPDSATSVTFGARIKIAEDDKLKLYNWCGIYCTQDVYTQPSLGTGTRYVNYFGIKNSSDTYTRKTGTLTGLDAQYNWNGLQNTSPPSGSNHYYFTPTTTHVTEHAMLDDADFDDFKRVEYTFNLNGGTQRKMGFTLYFAESIGNMKRANGDFTGGFQVFDPTVEFS
jgi:hypothetical protein